MSEREWLYRLSDHGIQRILDFEERPLLLVENRQGVGRVHLIARGTTPSTST